MFGSGVITGLKAGFECEREYEREREELLIVDFVLFLIFFDDLRFDLARLGVMDRSLEEDLLDGVFCRWFDFFFVDLFDLIDLVDLVDFLLVALFKACLFNTVVFTFLNKFGNGCNIYRFLEDSPFPDDNFFLDLDLLDEQRDLLEAERLLENPRFDRVRLRSKDFDLELFCLDLDRGFIADSTSYLIYLKLILIGVLLAFLADRFLELLVLRLLSLLSLFSFLIDDLRCFLEEDLRCFLEEDLLCFLEEDLILGGVYKSYWTILWGVGDTVFCLSS